MAKCLNCNNEAKGRSVYCGDTCRVVWNRNRKRNTEALIKSVTPVTIPKREAIRGSTGQGVTIRTSESNLEPIVIFGKPKRGKDIKYKMTVMERLFYRPAHLLKPGETNFVSLPGRACYGVV